MQAPLLTVSHTFTLLGDRGVILEPGPLESEYEGPRRFPVRLKLPDGGERFAEVVLESVLQNPPPKERRHAAVLKGLGKDEVPLGTEVYVMPVEPST